MDANWNAMRAACDEVDPQSYGYKGTPHYIFEPGYAVDRYSYEHTAMGGVTRTKQSRSSANLSGNPPRPPNAWILYRSDKMKQMTPPIPGQPPRPQSEISKAISTMWKNEPTDVRAHYERASDIKKAEHQLKYPNYRFQPLKKEDKERIREERKQEKERVKAEKHKSKATQRTVSGASSIGGQSATSASTAAPAHWTPSPEYFEPYMNPKDLGFRPSPSLPQSRVPSYKNLPALLKSSQSGSSTDVQSDTLDSASATASSPHPSIYPPSPELKDAPYLMTPQASSLMTPSGDFDPGEMERLLKRALDQYQMRGDIPEVSDTPSHNTMQEFIVPLPEPDSNFPADQIAPWFGFDPTQSDLFAYNGEQTGANGTMPTWTANGDPNSFDLADFDAYINAPPADVQLNTGEIDYLSFIHQFAPSQTLFDEVPSSANTIYSAEVDPSANYSRNPSSQYSAHPGDSTGAAPSISPSSMRTVSYGSAHASASSRHIDPSTHYTPPQGATNASSRRVGADWRRTFPSTRIPSN